MLVQALDESEEVVLFYVRNLCQLVFVIVGKKVVARFSGSYFIPLKFHCK
jgi:hypothetical protein